MFILFVLFIFVQGEWDPWWKLVVRAIDNQTLFEDICVSVGREDREFAYCKGNMTMDTPVETASSSKIVGAMPFYQSVVKGDARFYDPVSKYLDYWTKNMSDSRAAITLRDLVTFQSGYQSDPKCEFSSRISLRECVKRYYETTKHEYWPGTNWAYGETHLQILGAVMEIIYDQPIETILADALKQFNMTNSVFEGGKHPVLAATLRSTGNDYEQFLIQYFNDKLVPSDYRNLIEGDYNTPPGVSSTEINEIMELFVGHYGMTMWYECAMAVETIPYMSEKCEVDDVHSCPGLFGYWPLVDRKNNYWMQIVVEGAAVTGCIKGQFVRLIVKPFVDAAMEKRIISEAEMPNLKLLMETYELKKDDPKLREALLRM